MKVSLLIFCTIFFCELIFSQDQWVQKGSNIHGIAGSGFGESMSVSNDGQTIISGGIAYDGISQNIGHARVMTWSGGDWTQKGQDVIGDNYMDYLGSGVDISDDGNTIAVGAYGFNASQGFVRIFDWNGSSWIKRGNDILGESSGDKSGSSLSLSSDGNTVAIGAFENDANYIAEAGHVRVYFWDGNNWVQKGSDVDGLTPVGNFGFSVSLSPDGNTFIGGARKSDGNGNPGAEKGLIRVFTWDGNNWNQKGSSISGIGYGDQFGVSVDISSDANIIAAGGHYNSSGGSNAGHVRVFYWDGNDWLQRGNEIVGENIDDYCGQHISLSQSGSEVAVTSKFDDTNGNNTGHVRVFRWNGISWIKVGENINGPSTGSFFGETVSLLDNNYLFTGTDYYSTQNQSGLIKVFRVGGISGKIFNDLNESCVLDTNEVGLKNFQAIVTPGNYVYNSSEQGNIFIDSLPLGVYNITYNIPNNWTTQCLSNQNFTITNNDSTLNLTSFGLKSTQPCPKPNVSVNMPFMRPCFSNQKIYIQACNQYSATGSINSPYIDLTIDTLIDITSSPIPYVYLGNNVYRFQFNDTLNPGDCINYSIETSLSCNAQLGETLCMEANLFQIDSCSLDTIANDFPVNFTPCNLPWDKSSLSLEAECINDSIIFTIHNTGDPIVGDMDCYSPIRLFIDGQYILLDSIKIDGGDSLIISYPGDGRTWRLEVDQHPLHPGNSNPNVTIERCGDLNNWTSDLINILPHDDLDPITDIYCGIVTGSYDPNDKRGYPLGVSESHYISPNKPLEYMIRFQNTGNDTAFTVVIRDTLKQNLDVFSVIPGTSSHDYTFQVYGPRVMEWTFNNINLPDSNVNEPESHGFITFKVDQIDSLPNGTEIINKADIYFDYNAPIITDTTSHIINDSIKSKTWEEEKSVTLSGCDQVTYNGFSYSKSGDYYQIKEGTINDTLVNIEVDLNYSSTDSITEVLCDQNYTAPDGQVYSNSGNKTAILTNSFGCDSIINIDLTINNSTSSIDVIQTCDSLTWIDGNTYYNSNNSAQYIITNSVGCDSIINLDLIVNNQNQTVDSIIACDSLTWIDGNTYYANNNTAQQLLTNIYGCDSLVNLNLDVRQSTTSIDVIQACDSLMWVDGNTYYNSNNSAQFVTTNSNGCDSIVNLDLIINNQNQTIDSIIACDSLTWIDGNTYYANNSSAQHVLSNIYGCDSIINLDLTLYSSPVVAIHYNGESLSTNIQGDYYQWHDCYDFITPINGENSQHYYPSQNGYYLVEVVQNNCSGISDCYYYNYTNSKYLNDLNSLNIHPNPNNGDFYIDSYMYVDKEFSILDYKGKVVYKSKFLNSETYLNLKDLSKGIYLLKVEGVTKRFIIN